MMAIDYNLNNTELPVEKDIFIDNNILIYLFNPNTVNDYGYSNFLSDALEKNCKLYINSQVISEFVNTLCRVSFYEYKNQNSLPPNYDYKREFRNTEYFQTVYQGALQIVSNEILPITTVSTVDLQHITSSLLYNHELLDYNDCIIVSQCLAENIAIVTHDRDIINCSENIEVYHY